MPDQLQNALTRLRRAHQKRRSLELTVRLASGLGVASMLGAALWPWTPAAAIVAGTGVALLCGVTARRIHLESHQSPDDVAALLDERGATHDLVRTALCIVTGRSVGSDALATAIVDEAVTALPELEPLADTPFVLPRSFPVAVAIMGLLWGIPRPEVVRPVPHDAFDAANVASATQDAIPQGPSPQTTQPDAAKSASETTSSAGASAAGRDQRSSGGGADNTDQDGVSGGAGDRAADGDVDAVAAEGELSDGSGGSSSTAREAGTSGAEAGQSSATAPSTTDRTNDNDAPAAAPADAPGSEQDHNTTGEVELTNSVLDALRSTDDTMTLPEEAEDDRDAQTRSVAGTLDIQTSNPQFYDADEEADDEMNGDGGAGGWTVGLSQPGEGGVNDASGSTWKTEAGLDDPPDWSDAPTEWVDAAWQDSPAGVIRRVKNGQAGGSGSAEYLAAWHRYAAVAEADTTTDRLSPGRRSLIQQYFLAIAPTEAP